MRRGYRAIEPGVLWYRRLDRAHRRLDRARREFVSGFLDRALTMDEKERIGAAIYDAELGHRSDPGVLFDWERDWYEEELPAAPARILVGAAGAGRELKALVEMGYAVDAFEPAETAARLCRTHVGPGGEVVVGSYGDLVAGKLPFSEREYDAVILGWGSLSHVLCGDDQADLVRTCAALSPEGPILASFWGRSGEAAPPSRRSRRSGLRIGSLLSMLRGLGAGEAPDDSTGLIFAPWAGFSAPLSSDELSDLAAAVSRSFRWNSGGSGYSRGAFVVA